MGEEETTSKLVWNFDDAEAKLIFSMKETFIYHRDNWDLENAYWALLRLLSEIEPLFDDTVKEKLNEKFDEITSIRDETNKFSNLKETDLGKCFNILNDFYRDLCFEIVEKDLYFRKKKEYLGL
jgi:hypothetical protein